MQNESPGNARKQRQRTAVRELLAAADQIQHLAKEIQRLDEIVFSSLEICWDCAGKNLPDADVCVHCGQLLDEDDYRETMNGHHKRAK